jgi:hypothetical protein
MPNWCDNHLTVIPNTQENLDKFLIALSAMQHNEHQLFETFLPTPEEMLQSGEWYNWRVSHWGTKWDVCELYYEQDDADKSPTQPIHLSFETAWSPPIQFYQYLQNIGFTVHAQYFEPGCGFIGSYSNGTESSYTLDSTSIKEQEVIALLDEFGCVHE